MPYRTGTLSSFSIAGSAFDQFNIKTPYNPSVPSYSQNSNALIKARDFNWYFDAAYKIEQTFANGWGQGGTIVALNDSTVTPTLLIEQQTLTIPSTGGLASLVPGFTNTGNVTCAPSGYVKFSTIGSPIQWGAGYDSSTGTITLAGTVPIKFGTNPFSHPGFGIHYTLCYFDNNATNSISGAWDLHPSVTPSWDGFAQSYGPGTAMLDVNYRVQSGDSTVQNFPPASFLSIIPTGGSNYNISITFCSWLAARQTNFYNAYVKLLYVLISPDSGF